MVARKHRTGASWVLGMTALLLALPQVSRSAEVELKVVKNPELEQAIKAQKGKIVVLDVWGDFCIPCKKEFPNLVKLHERYAKDGVACMSVSVDELDAKESALKFLQKQKATFPNLLLNEPADNWPKEWTFKGPPAVLVYNRAGKLVRRFDYDDPCKQFTYADVEKLVKELLSSR